MWCCYLTVLALLLYTGVPRPDVEALHYVRGGAHSHLWQPGRLHPSAWGPPSAALQSHGARRNCWPDWTDSRKLGKSHVKYLILFDSVKNQLSFKVKKAALVNVSSLLPAAKAKCLQGLLQQPAGSQGSAGPEEAGPAGAGLPAALPWVPLQQEAGSVELPGHSTLSPGQVPTAAQRDTETHSAGAPRRCRPGGSGKLRT